MRNMLGAAALIAALALDLSVALAAGNDLSGPTVGDCIVDDFYRSEPFVETGDKGATSPAEVDPGTQAGTVTAPQEPGGSGRIRLSDGSELRGVSVGDVQQDGVSVPQECQDWIVD